MNKEFRRAAERMLSRATALGLTTKSGTPAVVDLMEELLAASQGYRNAHAARAALAKQAPKEVNLSLQAGQDCWLTLGAFVVHPNLTDEGIVVDVFAKGALDETIASTWAMQDDAEAALCEQECVDIDDVADWTRDTHRVNLDGCSLAERWLWLERFIEAHRIRSHQAALLIQWRDLLESLGYEFVQDDTKPDTWFWHSPSDEAEERFATADEAVAAAWRDACQQAMAAHGLTPQQWDARSFAEHKDLLTGLFD
jgi:hypothetical protein